MGNGVGHVRERGRTPYKGRADPGEGTLAAVSHAGSMLCGLTRTGTRTVGLGGVTSWGATR
jgi:hypothetical protein